MKQALVVFARLPMRAPTSETEIEKLFTPLLSEYGFVKYRGSCIMSCGPYGATMFYRFCVDLTDTSALVRLMQLCEKSHHGFVGAVMNENIGNLDIAAPLTIRGEAITYLISEATISTEEELNIASLDAHCELQEMTDYIQTLEYENRVMRALLDIEDGQNPLFYRH